MGIVNTVTSWQPWGQMSVPNAWQHGMCCTNEHLLCANTQLLSAFKKDSQRFVLYFLPVRCLASLWLKILTENNQSDWKLSWEHGNMLLDSWFCFSCFVWLFVFLWGRSALVPSVPTSPLWAKSRLPVPPSRGLMIASAQFAKFAPSKQTIRGVYYIHSQGVTLLINHLMCFILHITNTLMFHCFAGGLQQLYVAINVSMTKNWNVPFYYCK